MDSRTFGNGPLSGDIKRTELVEQLRGMRATITDLGVTGLALFGSRARGDNRDDSDIDLLVDIASDRKFSLLDLVAVADAVEDRLGLPTNVFLRRSLDPDFLASAYRDEVVIFRG